MLIRKSTSNDLPALMALFDEARGTIAKLGIDQWQDGYPSEAVIAEDIQMGRSYVVELEGKLCGTFVLVDDGEPTYDRIYDGHWKTGDESRDYIAIHRVAVSVERRGQGVSAAIIRHAQAYARSLDRSSVRIDTHRGNTVMRRMLEKNGFEYCGVIYLQSGASRVAYERPVKLFVS